MNSDKILKNQLQKHLFGGEAFMPVDEMLKKIPYEKLGVRPKNLPYSFYEILYHMWFTQKDILDYCLKPNYRAPTWSKDYWPAAQAPADPEAWENLLNTFFKDRETLEKLVSSEENDLRASVPSHKDHTLLREVMLVIEHSAYHTGQLLILLRLLGLK